MSETYFTRDDVQESAGVRPWDESREFSAEIDPGSMAETAALYARAAADAGSAAGLADRATALAAEAGTLDGAALVDADGRVDATALALDGAGEGVETVVRLLVRAMNTAVDAEHDVAALIEGPGGLDEAYAAQLASADTAARICTPGGDDGPRTPEQIRRQALDTVAATARTTHEAIADTIAAYRARLSDYGWELLREGHDLTGPLALWTTPEMAEYAAGKLAEELRRDDPDPDALARWTETLEGITDSVYGNSLDPGEPARRLTGTELAYLRRYWDALDPGTLAALGSLDGWAEAKVHVANSLAMLLDPGIGGGTAVPAAVRPFVLDHRDSDLFTQHVASGLFRHALERFNAVADVIGSATVPTGDRFAETLAHAALDIHERSTQQYAVNYPGHALPDTGSSDLLTAAALNDRTAAALLTDDDFRVRLLSQSWEDSTGAGALIRSGTTLPPGMDRTSPAADPYADAARDVLSFAATHQDTVLGHGPSALAALGDADHTPLQAALADTALAHMPDVAGYGDHPLPEKERYGVFSLMAQADPAVNEGFKAGVNSLQYAMAYGYYADIPGAMGGTNTFETIGNLTRLVNWGEHEAIDNATGDTRARLTSDLTKSSIGGALWAASVPPGPQQLPLGLIAAGYSAAVPVLPGYTAQAPAAHTDYDLSEGFVNEQVTAHTIASAAAQAHAEGTLRATYPHGGAPAEVAPLDTDLYATAGAVPDRRLNDTGDRLGVADDWRTAGVSPYRYVPAHTPDDPRAHP
ncbi:hypothetical protein [Streptomyces sp. NPDC049879]|uniref:hypothetical protein n=1 Tax=Streptomyces sp. NPDC049879 TaxID=3365598 RepID=UPI0037981E9B